MHKTLTPFLATALMLAFAAHAADDKDKPDAAAKAPGKDYTLLKVDGDEIKRSEVEGSWREAGKYIFQGKEVPPFDSMPESLKEKFLREVASEHVLYKEALKEGLENSPEMQAAFEKLKHQAIIQELLKQKTSDAVTDEKLKSSYDQHLKDAVAANGGRDEIHARHILLKTKEAAEKVEKQLKNGGDFEKIAKEQSEDKNTGPQGGDMGWVNPDKLVPEFAKEILKLKKGEISKPIKTDFGWHVIQVEDWRALPAPPYADVKDSLKQEAGNKAVGDYVKTIMKGVKITELDTTGDKSINIPSTASDKEESSDGSSDKGGSEGKEKDKDANADQ